MEGKGKRRRRGEEGEAKAASQEEGQTGRGVCGEGVKLEVGGPCLLKGTGLSGDRPGQQIRTIFIYIPLFSL